jgi:hypothetical protein
MAIDYQEKEREFLDSLEADTGRPLDAWMAAISAQNLAHRNDIIDWLRQQGFLFAKASWLERIHHNGGKPIYADGSAPVVVIADADPPRRVLASPVLPVAERPAGPELEAAKVVPAPLVPATATSANDLEALLAQAKAYRPLAQYVLREIATAVPAAQFTARDGFVALSSTREFGVLTITPKELRLGLAMDDAAIEDPLIKARFPKPAPSITRPLTHMAILTDARQVTDALVSAIAAAAR